MSLYQHILEKLKSDSKINIIRVIKGLPAVEEAEILFFPTELIESKKWSSQWDLSRKKNAVLIIYSRMMRVKKQLAFKFIIGDSVLGEKYR